MESNWRLNVAKIGYVGSSFQMIARLVGFFIHPRYVIKESATTWGIWEDNPLSTAPLVRLIGPIPILAGQRFPFGLLVDPD